MRRLIYHQTAEEPAEYADSDNVVDCYYAIALTSTCGGEIDLDEDEHSEIETPLGTVYVCPDHMCADASRAGYLRPYLMCACGEDELPISKGPQGWSTDDGVIAREGRLYSAACGGSRS